MNEIIIDIIKSRGFGVLGEDGQDFEILKERETIEEILSFWE